MDARRALISVMKQNAAFRTAYEGTTQEGGEGLTHPVYVFEDHKRVNGMFHVLQLEETVTPTQMLDVDNWHPKRQLFRRDQVVSPSADAGSRNLLAKHTPQP